MFLGIVLASLLLWQPSAPSDPALAGRIHELLWSVLTGNEKQESAAAAEASQLFTRQGLLMVEAVGDEAAYEFVVLICAPGPIETSREVLHQARSRNVPKDAVAYCAAQIRGMEAKNYAQEHPPANPGLRDQIVSLFKADQAVRQKQDFDAKKMEEIDAVHRRTLEAIFREHGVPTYRLVGPEAASNFVTMMQHQPTEFRRRMAPKLKANVRAGHADPGSYATVFDRLRTDSGKKQVYGENLVCDAEHPKLHTGPIEDERNVNMRRARIGLMRLELYARFVVAISPDVCSAPRN